MPTVLLVTPDLMFASQAGAVVRGLGAEFVMSGAGQLADKLTADTRLVVFDAAAAGLDPAALVAQVRATQPQAAILAYGAHVQHERLEQARAAGCNEVLTRGQFSSGMKEVIARHLAP